MCSYVPIKIDYSDIYDTMAYFVGTPEGQGGHDSIAEKMGEQGRQWTKKYWRRADMAFVPSHSSSSFRIDSDDCVAQILHVSISTGVYAIVGDWGGGRGGLCGSRADDLESEMFR